LKKGDLIVRINHDEVINDGYYQFILEENFEFCGFVVPKGFRTDFASIPKIFWSILPPDGKYILASVVHDYLYTVKPCSRKEADRIFLKLMKISKCSKIRCYILYYCVRLFGFIRWKKK